MKYLLFIVFLFALTDGYAQYNTRECATIDTAADFLSTIPPSSLQRRAGRKVMKMYIVIYADDNGTNQAISEETLKSEILFTNTIFNQGDICFVIAGIEFRNSTVYNNPVTDPGNTNYSSQTVSDAFTVFIVRTIDGQTGNNGVFGWVPSTPSSYMVTRTAGFGVRRTFVHEMGHGLGLHHTFKGTGNQAADPGCHELVNGSNGSSCGDLVADTPADPYVRCGDVISGCSFPYTAPACQDANGSSYAPQMNNFMSYWPNFGCNRTVFTAGQYDKMRTTIDNNPFLSSYIAPATVVLTDGTVNSGTLNRAAESTILAGSFFGSGTYFINGSAKATLSAGTVTLTPGFTAAPANTTGLTRIIASSCQ